jgi:hypothetical protein
MSLGLTVLVQQVLISKLLGQLHLRLFFGYVTTQDDELSRQDVVLAGLLI